MLRSRSDIWGNRRGVDPLLGLLRDQDADVRAATADALGSLGDKRAVEPLISLLK